MSTYVIQNGELYHHGVPGMKWGVRKADKRAARADRKIKKIERLREINKSNYDKEVSIAKSKYSDPKKAKKLDNALAKSKAKFDTTEVSNKYNLARQKAKKDPTYKQSEEYIKAKSAFMKQSSQQFMFTEKGHVRIETLKNKGMSEKAARGRVAAEYMGAYAVATLLSSPATIAVTMALMNKK